MTEKNSVRGKKSRAAGQRFELKVRKDLESNGWFVAKWMNNVALDETTVITEEDNGEVVMQGKLVPAKRKYNPFSRAFTIGTGFPDFIAHRHIYDCVRTSKTVEEFYGKVEMIQKKHMTDELLVGNQFNYNVIGIEAKSNGYLDKTEKQKCDWLLNRRVFEKIFIAKKGKKRGEIVYEEYKSEDR
jgi:hypothetical protein